MKTLILKKGFVSLADVNGQLHITDTKNHIFPIEWTGSANDINPPVRIFYGSQATATADFQTKTYFSDYGNLVHQNGQHKLHSDKDGKYFKNNYKKGEKIIFAH